MRRVKTGSLVWRAWVLGLGLGLAVLGTGIGLAQAEGQLLRQQTLHTLASSPSNEFVCHAKPGGWCDLRDWGTPVGNLAL
jgi:hypothetical protein